MELKAGKQFEVVEVLTDGTYDPNPFKIGGHTVCFDSTDVLVNGRYSGYRSIFREKHGCCTLYMFSDEVKPVGRLIVTKVKQNENTL